MAFLTVFGFMFVSFLCLVAPGFGLLALGCFQRFARLFVALDFRLDFRPFGDNSTARPHALSQHQSYTVTKTKQKQGKKGKERRCPPPPVAHFV